MLFGGNRRSAERAGWPNHVGSRRKMNLTVTKMQSGVDEPLSTVQPSEGTSQPPPDPAPTLVARPRDGARCFGDAMHQHVRVCIAERERDRILILERQYVSGVLGASLQLDARIEENGVRRG